MKARITIIDIDQNEKEIINVDNIENKNKFSYKDSYNANNCIEIFDDGIVIDREADTHKTRLFLKEETYVEIMSEEGNLKFSLKVLANNINNDNIYLVYEIDHSKKSIQIEFVKDK